MSVPPPRAPSAAPVSGSAPQQYRIPLEAERSWTRPRGGDDALVFSALGATVEHERMLNGPLVLPLGLLEIAVVERDASARHGGRFPILRRLSPTAVVP